MIKKINISLTFVFVCAVARGADLATTPSAANAQPDNHNVVEAIKTRPEGKNTPMRTISEPKDIRDLFRILLDAAESDELAAPNFLEPQNLGLITGGVAKVDFEAPYGKIISIRDLRCDGCEPLVKHDRYSIAVTDVRAISSTPGVSTAVVINFPFIVGFSIDMVDDVLKERFKRVVNIDPEYTRADLSHPMAGKKIKYEKTTAKGSLNLSLSVIGDGQIRLMSLDYNY